MNEIDTTAWDPAVLRKYTSTGHFRLLNQVRTELKANPLVRPGEGESVAEVNRSRSLLRALQARPGSGGRSRRASARGAAPVEASAAPAAFEPLAAQPLAADPSPADAYAGADDADGGASFRERLRAIDMR